MCVDRDRRAEKDWGEEGEGPRPDSRETKGGGRGEGGVGRHLGLDQTQMHVG